jgi:hypothetical protein
LGDSVPQHHHHSTRSARSADVRPKNQRTSKVNVTTLGLEELAL